MSFFEKLHVLRCNSASKTGKIPREAIGNRFNTLKSYDSNIPPSKDFFQPAETFSKSI